ncbi:MAG: hypothetical protein ACD_79C00255G0001 [uncultured bacterium]|nr:MAG: hypothetical protein ACD_79C00255G0001 [uncultured bacterium]
MFSLLLVTGGCAIQRTSMITSRPPQSVMLMTSGYCDCRKCTGWKRNWKYQTVYAYGHLKGKPKEVGITSDGTKARKGIIAADTDIYPFGTTFYIPGYGYGEVHDRGGLIKGKYRIDLFFKTHKEALNWGKKTLKVDYWK